MKKSTGILSIFICIILILNACTPREKTVNDYEAEPVADLYHTFWHYHSTDSATRAGMIAADSVEVAAMLKVISDIAPDSLLLQAWCGSLPVAVFSPAADSIYPDVSMVERNLGAILARSREEGLDIPERRYAAVVWGKYETMMFVDSVMLIALNHYLGAEYDGYSHFPLYMRLTKEPSMLPYDIAEAIIGTSYPYESDEQSNVLQRMLYEGALAVAKQRAVPQATLDGILGYRPEQTAFVQDEERNLWQALVGRELLYDTSEATVSRLFDPAPNTPVLDNRCPGRVGRYLGYRIVQSYLEKHPDATLPYLLSPEFYKSSQTLAEADYRP